MAYEPIPGDLTGPRRYPKGKTPHPLLLGSDGRISLRATATVETAYLDDGSGERPLLLTRRGAAALADWLQAWARPRTRIKLWGCAEIIREFKIGTATLANWRRYRSFPKPLAELASGPVWERRAVENWVKLDRPRRGPRPKRRR